MTNLSRRFFLKGTLATIPLIVLPKSKVWWFLGESFHQGPLSPEQWGVYFNISSEMMKDDHYSILREMTRLMAEGSRDRIDQEIGWSLKNNLWNLK